MKKAKRLYLFLALVFIIFSCCLVIIPLYFTVLNSFKPYSEIAANIAAFPHNPTLSNFKEAWRRLDFLRVLGNTLIVTVFSAIGTVILSGMTLYQVHFRVCSVPLFFQRNSCYRLKVSAYIHLTVLTFH